MIDVDLILPRKNFTIRINESFSDGITGIFGPSGSGKTSILHSISGLEKPSKGKIVLKNRVLYNSEKKINIKTNKRNVGYVFQEGRLFPHLTVKKNLLYGKRKNGKNLINLSEVTDLLNLGNFINSTPMQISGGERQRVALGRTLLSSPDILLLDEPFSAVDMSLRNQIISFINEIREKVNIPILVVSHELPDLLKLTNDLLVINNGKCLGHDKYYNLLGNKKVSEIIGDKLLNAIDLKVTQVDYKKGLTILSSEESTDEIKINCKKSNGKYPPGAKIKIFINADEIALSEYKINNTTIQNQIKGEIIKIFEKESCLLCIINVGFKIVVEITSESMKRMKLKPGKGVWCLFKSAAIDVAG